MMLSYLSSILLFLLSGGEASAQEELSYEPYLAPHEQHVFNALNNMDKDFNGFLKIFAKNAYCELSFGKQSDDVNVKSGPCRDVFSDYGNMAQYNVKWYPLTNTHPQHPEKGVLSYGFVNYGLTETGCEGLVSGTSELKFNIEGKVTDFRGHSTETSEFINCVDKNKKIVQGQTYLAPHEQDVYDALDNIHKDFDAFAAVFAENAQCDVVSGQAPTDIAFQSGSCKEVWGNWDNIVRNKIKWIPVTNTHARNPDKGVLAVTFWHYALAENGCEGLIGGTGTLRFNEDGLVTRLKSYSTELMDFMDCIDNIAVKPK